MPPAPLELAVPDLDEPALVALLSEHLVVRAAAPRREELVLLDTFDARMRAAGLSAQLPASRAERVTLTVHETGAPVLAAEVARAPRLLLEDIPAGPVRERLAGVLEMRALLPLARVRQRVLPVAALNADSKTVARLEIARAAVMPGGGRRVQLEPRLHVRPVLGYDRDFQRIVGVLTGMLGLPEAGATLFDAALAAAGRDPAGFSSKPAVKLARGTATDIAVDRVLARLADIAEGNARGAIDDLDTEFLHDLRVAVRRARSVLREMRDVHAPGPRDHLRRQLRWVQQLTGPLRDLDVQLLEWGELTAGLEEERRSELDALRDVLVRHRAAELRRMRRGLRSERFAATLSAWRDLTTTPPAAAGDPVRPRAALPIEATAGERIRRVYRRMVRDGSAIGADSPDEALHDLRKRGKELRYLLELFGGLFPAGVVKPMVASLKDLQNVLGRFQDRAVQVEKLRGLGHELAATPGGPATLMALGVAVEALLADQRAARGQFATRFAAFAAPEQQKLVRKTFPKT